MKVNISRDDNRATTVSFTGKNMDMSIIKKELDIIINDRKVCKIRQFGTVLEDEVCFGVVY